jgi:tRNA (guanosine-2'-O-)-methyltransferase
MPETLLDFLTGFVSPARLARLERTLESRTRHVAVVLEDLYHPHNAGACLRTCEGFGVQDVHVVENSRQFSVSRKAVLGAAQWLTLVRHNTGRDNTLACYEHLRRDGYRIMALLPGAADSVYDYDIRARTALVFGNEMEGLSADAVAHADGQLAIPLYGFTQSLNISVALAITLSTLVSRLHALEVDWQITPAERRALRAEWIRAAVGSKAASLEREYRKRFTPAVTGGTYAPSSSEWRHDQ